MKKLTLLLCLIISSWMNVFGQWTSVTMPGYRWQLGSAAIGPKLFLAGGENAVDVLKSVEIYDTETGQWTSTEMSIPRRLPDVVSSGSKLFVVGGFNVSNQTNDVVDIYDTLTKQWTAAQLSEPRFGISAVSKDGVVLFAGGSDVPAIPFLAYDIVDVYHAGTGTWTTTNMSLGRVGMGSTVAGNKAFFAGGELGSGAVSDRVDIYDFGTGAWSTATLSVPRFLIGAASVGNKVIFAGGVLANGIASNRIDIYNLDNGQWSTGSLWAARGFYKNVATICDKAYFVGGVTLNPVTGQFLEDFKEIDIFDGATNTWSVNQLPYDLKMHTVSSIGNQLMVAGGGTNVGLNIQLRNTIQIFTDTDCMVGVNDLEQGTSFIKVFPNPASESINVLLEGITYADFILTDALGRRVQQGRWMDETNTLQTASLEPGIYYLLVTSKGKTENRVIILQ